MIAPQPISPNPFCRFTPWSDATSRTRRATRSALDVSGPDRSTHSRQARQEHAAHILEVIASNSIALVNLPDAEDANNLAVRDDQHLLATGGTRWVQHAPTSPPIEDEKQHVNAH